MKTSQFISTVLASIGLISAIQVFLSYKWLMAFLEPIGLAYSSILNYQDLLFNTANLNIKLGSILCVMLSIVLYFHLQKNLVVHENTCSSF